MAGNVSKKLAKSAQVGKDGVGIKDWRTEGESLYISLTDGRVIEVGNLKGPGATVRIGEVILVDSDQEAKIINVGTETDAVLNFEIPRGRDGGVTDEYASMYWTVLAQVDSVLSAAHETRDIANRVEELAEHFDVENIVKSGADNVKIEAAVRMLLRVLDGELELKTGYGNQILFDGLGLLLKHNGTEVFITSDGVTINGVTVATDNSVVDEISRMLSAFGESVVHKSGNEEIRGLKNFTGTLQVSGSEVATKQTIDAAVNSLSTEIGKKVNYSDAVHMTGSETVSGVKNFKDGISIGGKAAATEDYVNTAVDNLIIAGGGSGEGFAILSFEVFNAHKTDGVYAVLKNGLYCLGIIRTQSKFDSIYRYLWDGDSIKVSVTKISTGVVEEDYADHFNASYADEAGHTGRASFAEFALADTMGNTIHETYATKAEVSALNAPVKSSVTILGGSGHWVAEDVLSDSGSVIGQRYGQVVNVNNATITPNSKVDLQLTSEQTALLYGRGLAFVAENDNGVVTVYCIGEVPEDDYTFQAVVTEVVVNA